jgi:type I site-specific restriction-modification system R (restriction) subunit
MPKTGCFVTSKSKLEPILWNQEMSHLAFSGQRQITAHGLRRAEAALHAKLGNPTVIIVVDRIDLDTQINGDLSEQDRDDFAKRAAKMAVLGKNLEGVRAVVQHRVIHFQTKVEPNGFKAQVVTFDRKCCVLLKFSIAFRVAGGQPV